MRDSRGYEREQGRGHMPHKSGDRQSVWKRIEVYFVFLCTLLVVNLFFLMKLQSQIGNMAKSLDQVLAAMAVGRQEEPGDELTARQTEVSNPQYNAAPVDPAGGENGEGDSVAHKGGLPEEVDYVELCGLPEVDKPVDRKPSQVLKYLEELAADNEMIAEIWKNHAKYPEEMLKALANNPEMADFVSNYLTADAKASGAGLTRAEKEQRFPLFLQWDPRWGYAEYGDDSVGLSGCGPTCLSMALYYLLRDESITPDVIAEYSMDNGYYMAGTGTAWKLLEDVAVMHGVNVTQPKASDRTLKHELDQGNIIICSMKPGDFTAGGHFIVIYGYDEEGFLVNDPNCVARSRQKWSFDSIERQIKHTWSYSADFGADFDKDYDISGKYR